MLKPKHCYANEEVYNYNLFLQTATVHAFALNPYNMTQVKFVMNNKETIANNCVQKNFFVFVNRIGKTRPMERADAKSILKFIDIIGDSRIEDYTDKISRLKYHTVKGDKSIKEFLSVVIAGVEENIIKSSAFSLLTEEKGDKIRKQEFNKILVRLKLIMQQFIDLDNAGIHEAPTIPYHFESGRFVVYPLVNKESSWTATGSLRLMKIAVAGEVVTGHICFNYKGKDLLFYSREKSIKSSSTLNEIVEGFISGLKNLVAEYNSFSGDINYFISSVPITLSEDRKHFMEYVGARGVANGDQEGAHQSMIVNVNSDAAPASSKVWFHYHPEFMQDLYNGLRYLVNL